VFLQSESKEPMKGNLTRKLAGWFASQYSESLSRPLYANPAVPVKWTAPTLAKYTTFKPINSEPKPVPTDRLALQKSNV
jgi:hypothetical protein